MELIEIFQSPWAMRALLASSLVGIMCGALGAFVVLRNMSLIGDALAHAILPGIVIAFILVGHNSFGFFIGAVLAGLLTAVMITWIQGAVKTKNDAAIGIVFTTMFAFGVIGISRLSKNEGVHLDLKDFLFGSVLGVSDVDLQLTAATTLVVLLGIGVFFRQLFVTTFQPIVAAVMGVKVKTIHYLLMLLLSFAVVASLRTVGVILVVAMLITPAATALLLSSRLRTVIAISAIIGLVSSVLGLAASILLEITPGPAMAVTVTLFYFLAVLFSPSQGLLFNYFRKRNQEAKVNLEDLIKQSFHLQNHGQLTLNSLASKLGWTTEKIKRYSNELVRKGLATQQGELAVLNENGQKSANQLIRAHRLWEAYLVSDLGLNEAQIHADAEAYEHLLTEDLLEEVDAHLGYPALDPHGAPIPQPDQDSEDLLVNSPIGSRVKISPRQSNSHIASQLWKLGLTPGEMINIELILEEDLAIVLEDGQKIRIPKSLSEKVNILK